MAPLSLNKEKTGNSPISYIYRKDGINRKYQLLIKTNIHIMINLKIYIIVDHTPPLSFCYDTVISNCCCGWKKVQRLLFLNRIYILCIE